VAPLVGRREEISRLEHALSVADNDGGVFVTVVGEPGIGKSRLLDHLAAIAADTNRTVLFGRATEFERHQPFGVLIDALDETVETALTADPALADGQTKSLLMPVLPALRRHGNGAGVTMLAGNDRVGRCRELRRLLRRLAAARPIVLLLDDVHWIDQSSAEFLDYLFRHPTDPRLLIVLAYRPIQLPSLLAHSIDRAKANGWLDEIELPPLSIGEAAELVVPAMSGRELRAAYKASGGNPLYLEAISHQRAKRGASLDKVDLPLPALLVAELPAISADGLHLLQAGAVLGDPFDALHAAALAELDNPAAGVALDELSERDLVRPTGSVRMYRFRHPLVRSAVYSQAKRAWLVHAHKRAVEQLRGRGVGVVGIAHHVAQAADLGDLDAVAILEEAAGKVVMRAPATAARWLGDAERLLPQSTEADPRRVRLIGRLADALGRSGQLAESSRRLRDLVKLVPADHHDIRVPYICGIAEADHLAGRFDRARAQLQTELHALSQGHPRDQAALLVSLATGAFLRGALAEALDYARQANALTSDDGDPGRRLAAVSAHAITAAATGDMRAAMEASAKASAIADSLDDEQATDQLVHLGELAWANYYLGWHDQALRVADRAAELARRTGHVSTLPYLLLCACKAHQLAGRLRQALDMASHAEEIARLNGSDDHLSMALAAKAEAVIWIDGSTEPATQLAVRAVAAAGWRTGVAGRKAFFVLAEITLATGDAQRTARQLVAASGGPALPAWPLTSRPRVFELLTRTALAAGDIDRAQRWVAGAEQAATHPALGGLSYANRARAWLNAVLGDHKLAAELALAAADGFSNTGFPIEEGHARAVAARAFTSVNADADAAAELRRIKRIAQSCESSRLARLVDRDINAIPRPSAPQPAEHDPYAALSRREREVAALLATGMTNREIANQLYVTIRTVDAHVSRILRKLDVPSRAAVVGLQLSGGATHG
jgi:ATP/maltotriose-dependent transcriptional regulator MalT